MVIKYKKHLENPTDSLVKGAGGSLSFVNDLMFSKKKRKWPKKSN